MVANITLASQLRTSGLRDNSVIFSFLQNNPKLNSPLISENQTTTILARADQWIISQASASALLASANTTTKNQNFSTIQDNVIVKTNPADTQNLRHGKTTYEVQPGDTLVSVASSFGLSPATIMVENNLNPNSNLKPGQQLVILPFDGISYTLKENDSLEAIAAKYKIDLNDLLEVNDLELTSDAQAGDNIIIPTTPNIPKPATPKFITNTNGRVALTQAQAPAGFAPSGSLSFLWPTVTHNITQGFSSRHSGIDISDSQLEPIYAAEDGFVEIAGFQTNGYGNTILINHGNGFKTRYGHASELYVKAGDHVVKGQIIAKQGHTGHVRGATGIHLHFEIIANDRRVNPLLYVKP